MAVADRAAHDTAKDVFAAGAVGKDAFGDEERGRARVVGDDAHRDVVVGLRAAVRLAADLGRLVDEGAQKIGVVVRHLALHDARDALEPHAGVDARLRERRHRPALRAIELHEDEVPDLHPAAAVGAGLLIEEREVDVVAVEPMDFGARAARAGLAHRPEVVGHAHADDAVVREAADLLPDRARFVVGGDPVGTAEHGDDEAARIEAVALGDEVPRVGDRLFFEVVAEGEVTEHLEERVVARGDADVLEIVVLARDADAFLAARRARVRAPTVATGDG